MFYAHNEEKYYDLLGQLDAIEALGVPPPRRSRTSPR